MIANESNSTEGQVEWFPGLQTAACICYTIILIVGIIGNILVIIIVTKYRDMRNATNLLLANLSIADLFHLVFCTSDGYQHLYGKDKHRLGKFMCSFSPFVQNVTSTCSVLTIMAISYERYVAICQPLKTSPLHLTLFRTLPTAIFFWFISCFMSIPFYVYSNTELAQATYNEKIVTCFTHFPSSWGNEYLISCTLCLYLFIFLMLCYWHFSICCILFNREALLRDNTTVTRYRRQVAQLLIVLIITFFILILPYKIWAFIQQRLSVEEFFQTMSFHQHSFIIISTRLLLYLNSAINPLLYSIMSTKFRQSFFLLCDDCRRPTKSQRLGTVFFSKEYTGRPITGGNGLGGGIILTTGKISYHQPNTSQFQEKKCLLANIIPMPIIGTPPLDVTKSSYSECYI
ncbi:unnamed protein product [Rotaria sp. Silwood2]|nr:unnamed protein product [Rotaria sp. Silwood2]CAF2489766.1 unnamed protein product [Rotaria sp. Silwood2]CAF2720232.1 unnamed protein product [Rotaria sp. Silwood2]CAF2872991.1 unnamed protein product [Rotaria sp. Silwood2]CAF3929558.1 unnamed protein product [Rotaria sp. Silwood2]